MLYGEARGGTADLILPCLSKQSPKKNKRFDVDYLFTVNIFFFFSFSFFNGFVAMDRKVETFSFKFIW